MAPEDWATRMSDLGAVLRARGDLAGAQRHFEAALTRLRQVHTGPHRRVAGILHNLGECLYGRGELDAAKERIEQSLAMHRGLGEDTRESVAFNLTVLARIAAERSELEAAERYLRDAVEILREVHPEGHPELSGMLGSLGQVFFRQRKLEEAEDLARQALEEARRMLGEEHPGVAVCINNLAVAVDERGEHATAERLFRDAIAMHERLDPKDPNIGNPMSNLATMLRTRGDHAEAAALYERVLEVDRAVVGERHPKYGRTMLGIGRARAAMRDWGAAERWGRKALAVFRAVHPPGHRDIAFTTRHLAEVLIEEGKFSESQALARESALALDALGGDPGEAGYARALLGWSIAAQVVHAEEHEEAIRELAAAVEQLRASTLRLSKQRLRRVREWLAVVYDRSGRAELAGELRRENEADRDPGEPGARHP